MSENFLIKHRSSGIFFHPYGGNSDPGNNTGVVLHEDIHENMHWRFEIIDDYWGYITHVSSGKIIHPYGGSMSPGNDTRLVVHSDRHYGALFALDAVNDHVMHKGGRYAHPLGGSPLPGNNTPVVLHEDVHDAMRFQFVSTTDPNTEVLVYGNPTVLGEWTIINMVRNPLAEHVDTLEVKIGKSETESSKRTFTYKWEASMGVDVGILKASASESVQFMIEKSSSTTWSEEATRTREIRVSPGNTVVTWQYVFNVQQNLSKTVFQSNLLADTSSETETPDEVQYAM